MKSKTLISTLWVFTCFVLTGLGIIFQSAGPEYNGGIYYIAFVLLMSLLTFFLDKNKKLENFELPFLPFSLGVFILLFSEPLFENDHYRYLWEGNAFLRGYNPYRFPPESTVLDHLIFSGRERIGFSHLTTVYPPLAIIWFGLGGIFDLDIGLRVLMILNALLVYFSFKKLRQDTRPWMLICLFPFFAKEFIQAIHIDLLAAFFFLLFLLEKNQKFIKSLLWIFLSIWTKILGIAALPFLLFMNIYNKKEILKRLFPIILVAASLPLFLEWLIGLDQLIGVKEFTVDWEWNPGFYSVLTRIFDLYDETARRWTGISYLIYISLLTLLCLKKLLKDNWELDRNFCLKLFYLIFSGLMFFTPVYNGWYAIWFIIPALLLSLSTGIFYGILSALCYLHYGFSDYHAVAETFTHIWFPISLWQLYRRKQTD